MSDGESFPIDPAGFNFSGDESAPAINPGGYALDRSGVSTTLDRGAPVEPGNFFTGLKDGFASAGSLAKAALPIAGLGAGIFGAINAGRVANQSAQESVLGQRARQTQIDAAQKATSIAPSVEAVAPAIAAIAPQQNAVAQRLQTDVAAPLTRFGGERLAAASRGEIPAAEEEMIREWADQEKMKLTDFFSRAGLGESDMLKTQLAEIDKKAVGMRMQGLTAEEQLGLTAEQAAGGVIGAESDVLGGEASTLAKESGVLTSEMAALTGAAGASGSAANAAQDQEAMLAKLIADAQAAVARMSASTA